MTFFHRKSNLKFLGVRFIQIVTIVLLVEHLKQLKYYERHIISGEISIKMVWDYSCG